MQGLGVADWPREQQRGHMMATHDTPAPVSPTPLGELPKSPRGSDTSISASSHLRVCLLVSWPLQCFDLESYLQLNCERGTWRCPVCK